MPTKSDCNDCAKVDINSRIQTLINRTDSKNENLLHIVGTKRNHYDGENKHDKKVIQVRDTTRMLLDLGADKKKRYHKGRTPLSTLAVHSFGFHNGIIASKVLLDRGADPDLPDLNGQTPLHYAVQCRYTEAMKDLIKAGANIEARNQEMCTPLHKASQSRWSPVVQFLLANKADHGAKDLHGATPLHYTARSDGTCGETRMLIKAKADLNAMDKLGSTPLHWAAKFGQSHTVGALLSAGRVVDGTRTVP